MTFFVTAFDGAVTKNVTAFEAVTNFVTAFEAMTKNVTAFEFLYSYISMIGGGCL